jgi:predicted nucleic-acid-binding protein
MIGIDTNVFVRYIIQDDAEQVRKATRFLERECTIDNPGLVNSIVLCEMVWVLESVYRYSRQQVSIAIDAILRAAQLKVENSQDARAALGEYGAGADFADALIATTNLRLGCEHTVTFNRASGRRTGFLTL